ncbi:MAG TPA: DoxX family protein [Gemmatimonadaceae bacterium]|nr:DoxX family protein [Gemmatimonadaceae bacterium]
MHTSLLDFATLSAGLLIVRLVVGLLMAAHGSQKLFGWFGGHGIAGTGMFFESIGFRPGRLFAPLAATTELVSGLLVALGLLGPVGPALMLSVMIVAAVSVHWKNGIFATSNGIEVALFYGTAAVGLALIGFGSYSLDALLGLQSLYTPTWAFVALAVGVLGGVGNLLARRPVVAA